MQQHRIERLNKLLHQTLSNIIGYELRDSRLEEIHVEYVIVSSDMRDATVFFTVLDEEKKFVALEGLNNASKVIRKKLAESLNLRYTPQLHFKFDKQEPKAQHIEEIIEEERKKYESD